MKNLSLAILMILFVSSSLIAQVTLNASDYPTSLLGADSLKMTTYNSSFPSLTPVAGGMWDMSTVTDSVPVFFTYRVTADTPYQFADSTNIYIFLNHTYYGSILSSLFDTGFYEFGIEIHDTNYNIDDLTGGIADSLIFPAQHVLYSHPRTKIAFPATYGSSWSSVYSYDVGYNLTYSYFSINHEPGIVRSYITDNESVTGWGKMRVKDAGGTPSLYFDVLQVEARIVKKDSIFLNDSLMSPSLLTTFGITQGASDTTYEQYYYRIGEVTPLAQVEFRDAGYTLPYKATTHVQRLTDNSVNEINKPGLYTVFPNPVTGDFISLLTTSDNGTINYQLLSANGQVFRSGHLTIKNNLATIPLPRNITAGTLFLQLNENTGATQTIQLEIIR